MAATGGKPILVLPEGTQRTVGRDARRVNIMTARAISEAVRTTLGPRGMDKMLVDSLGDCTITNDGVSILDEMEIEHPTAKMMVEVAKTQEDIAGDGTTTAVAIAGELLHESARLLDQGIHPTSINAGYKMAAVKAEEILDSISERVGFDEVAKLKKIAMTAMTGKKVEYAREKMASYVITAVKQVADKIKDRYVVDIDHVGVEKKRGGGIDDSEIVYGVIVDKERVHPDMPKQLKNAKIALLDCPLEIEKTETDAKIRISDPDQLKAFLDEEENMLHKMVDVIKGAGANVVLCQKGIDDTAQHFLAKAGILAVRRVKKSDMEKLARASGGNIVSRVEDLTADDRGNAGLVEERKIGEDKMIFVKECKEPKAVGLLVRGGTEHVVDEVERAIHDAICVVAATIEDGKFVAGGGAPEIELARKLREYAGTVGGREALAINAFANAVEIVPRTLIESAGLDPIDLLVELRAKHEKEGKNIGLDVFKGKPIDMIKLGIIEPSRVKIQAIKSASEAAIMILRIDDVISATKKEAKPPTPPPEGEGESEEF